MADAPATPDASTDEPATVYVVGNFVGDRDDVILSHSAETPVDDTVVWIEADGDDSAVTMVELEAANPDATIEWEMEPQAVAVSETVDPEAVTAGIGPDGEPELEAEIDRRGRLINLAEERVGVIEGLLAQLMMAKIKDEHFDGPPVAHAAGAPDPTQTGAAMADVHVLVARIAAMADEDLGEDETARVETILERLEALEATVADLLADQVEDDEMPDDDPQRVALTVDETVPRARAAALTIAGEVPTKANIALKPADPDALTVEGGDPAEAIHMTLKFIGDLEPWTPEGRQLLTDVVEAWAASSEPFTANVGGAGHLGKDGAAVTFLDVPGLQDRRAALANDVMAVGETAGIDLADTYDAYLPHLTVGYDVDAPTHLMGQEIPFDRVALQWGPDVQEFPLGGGGLSPND